MVRIGLAKAPQAGDRWGGAEPPPPPAGGGGGGGGGVSAMSYRVRVLAGRVDRRAGSHFYHLELVQRLTARGHRVSLVCFGPEPKGLECEEVLAIAPPPPARKVLWRFQSLFDARHYSRELARLPLAPVDV